MAACPAQSSGHPQVTMIGCSQAFGPQEMLTVNRVLPSCTPWIQHALPSRLLHKDCIRTDLGLGLSPAAPNRMVVCWGGLEEILHAWTMAFPPPFGPPAHQQQLSNLPTRKVPGFCDLLHTRNISFKEAGRGQTKRTRFSSLIYLMIPMNTCILNGNTHKQIKTAFALLFISILLSLFYFKEEKGVSWQAKLTEQFWRKNRILY